MENTEESKNRRHFIRTTAAFTTGLVGLALLPQLGCAQEASTGEEPNIIGPRKGYSPQVGTLVSMLDWMRQVVLHSVQGLSRRQLDHLHDPQANTIGAMLLHLAATEAWYQATTFHGRPDYNTAEKERWSAAMNLGDEGRITIKGHDLPYYLNQLAEVRQQTLKELRTRDDKWLLQVDKNWSWGPTNNYCKWFHVCEHESNHNGQIKWLKSRFPGAAPGQD